MPSDGGCADGTAAETPVGGGVATCSVGGANLAPVSPSSVIRVAARLTSSRKYQTSQAMSAGQAAIFSNSRRALTISSSDISPAPKICCLCSCEPRRDGTRDDALHHAQTPAVLDHARTLPQSDGGAAPAFAGGAEGGERDLVILAMCSTILSPSGVHVSTRKVK